jgi:F-type H+-transporting ATPase subunit b
MPQFDPSSFSSQLFWFALCFSALYFAMSRVFLPRIRQIIKTRKEDIGNNDNKTAKLRNDIEEINSTTKELRESAAAEYKIAVEKSVKEATNQKQQQLENLKLKISTLIENSKLEIEQFKVKTQNENAELIENLATQIENKLFAKN